MVTPIAPHRAGEGLQVVDQARLSHRAKPRQQVSWKIINEVWVSIPGPLQSTGGRRSAPFRRQRAQGLR
ncbi:hypothetical protein M770_24015 [Pseudomonas aeruginosa VRFPA03]|nr:hypothetical protein M770_24015 [Pseudomonas aeruginosa VRFPA03]